MISMKKRALRKDFYMEIRKSLNRFLSILLIVALGVAFYSGIQSAAPDMRYSGDAYFDEHKLMDLKVVGTLGLTEDDVAALSAINGVSRAEPGYMTDVLCGDESQKVLHLESISPTLNQLTPIEGRLPQKSGECFVDIEFLDSSDYQIGDRITFYREEGDDLILKRDTFTIVGAGSSPLYISFHRGNTTLGNGELSGAGYILAEDFDSEVYTQIYLEVRGARNLTAYTDAYDTLIERVSKRVEEIEGARCQIRYDEVMEEAQEKLADARWELEDGKIEGESELADARQELEDGEQELADGKTELFDAKVELMDGAKQLADGRRELAENEETFLASKRQLREGKAELADGEAQLASGKAELAQKEAEFNRQYAPALREINSGEKQLANAKQQLASAKQQYRSGLAQYNQGKSEYDAGETQYAQGLAAYQQQAAAWPAQKAELAAQRDTLTQQQTQLEAVLPQLNAQLSQAQGALPAAVQAQQQAQSAVDAKNMEIADADARAADLQSQIDSLNTQIADLDAKIREQEANGGAGSPAGPENTGSLELKNQKSALEGQRKTAQDEKTAVDAQRASLQTELLTLQTELNNASAKVTELNTTIAALQGQIGQMDTIQNGIRQLESGISQGDTGLAEAKRQIDDMRALLDASKIRLTQSWDELTAAAGEIRAGEKEITANEKKLESGRAQLEDGRNQISEAHRTIAEKESLLANARREIADGEKELEDGRQQLYEGSKEIDQAVQKLRDGKQEYAEGKQDWKEGRQELANGREEYEDGVREYNGQIADAEQKIADAEKEIADIDVPEWIVEDRSALPENIGYGENADRMRSLGRVFPTLFFLVAALISLTTMTRMVEEERTQIGTLKALGYGKFSIASKYVCYALSATLIGSAAGIAVGEKFLPFVIVTAYRIMYHHVSNVVLPYNIRFALIATGAALFSTMAGTLAACYRELSSTPAALMRPPAPKEGKRVLLERIPLIWKHLSFSWKSTVRNLFRYKKRLFMTIFGISGCMALMIVGYGLRDSIMDVANLQFRELQIYDGMVILDEEASASEKKQLTDAIAAETRVEDYVKVHMHSDTVKHNKKMWDLYLMVPEDTETFMDFVVFRDRATKETYELTDEGAILTEKIANLMEVGVGDQITVDSEDYGEISIPVVAITENYLRHYIYLTPALYQKLYGDEPNYDTVLYRVRDAAKDQITQIGEDFLHYDAAMSISYTATIMAQLEDMLSALDSVILVLIVSAGLLAFVVLYNLNNININERKRELATLKVLGFYNVEVSAYVYRENILITAIGVLAGVLLGIILHRFTITTVEVDACMFGRNINLPSFLISAGFTAGFSVLVNFVMHFKLKKIDMVESLKSVE